GNYYQQQASTSEDSANQQGQLLSDLQVAMLRTLPTIEFVPLLKKPKEFEQHKSELGERAEKIKQLINSYLAPHRIIPEKVKRCAIKLPNFYWLLSINQYFYFFTE
ncbi:MAG: hypothetical protein ACYTXY_43685, partial [Nostoc sp.]